MLKNIRKLCTPARVYFLLSAFTLLIMILSNLGNKDSLCMGGYECPVDNIYLIYLIKVIYVLFNTIVLDSLCKNGFAGISWFLVFFPIIFFFIVLGLFMIRQNQTIVIVQQQEY